MSAEILRRAASEIRDEWSEDRAMGQDRTEWRTWRAVADWLNDTAETWEMCSQDDDFRSAVYTIAVGYTRDYAMNVARAYLGEVTP